MTINDFFYILRWFVIFFIIGLSCLPLNLYFFKSFKDKGYIFSKLIGLSILSYIVFILGILHLAKFNQITIIFILILLILSNYFIARVKNINIISIVKNKFKIFLLEELIFLTALIFWSFVRSNFPDIHGLEKFMDFGFINSILRTDYLPPKDMWYTPLTINYYYFGHLVTAVLIKLSAIPSFISFNLMVSTIFAFTLTLSFSIGMNLFDNNKFSLRSTITGLISAVFVSFAGNLTTIYAFFKPYVNEHPVPFWNLNFLPLSFPNNYWYPNATRFIPFTIHEFPIYSFVVSDLHGHVLDIPFVLLTIAFALSVFYKKTLKIIDLIFFSFLLSVMYMTNAWDGLIYLILGFLVILFLKTGTYDTIKKFIILFTGFITFSLPFSLFFKPFVFGIGILCAPTFLTTIGKIGPFLFEVDHCQKSPIWQLLLLYGFLYFFVVSLFLFLKFKKHYKIIKSDIFVLILIILSTLLIIIPEFIYIKDIYPLHYRANTMFKLTYQAFMMLSISSSFILIKLISNIKNKLFLIIFFILSLSLIYLILIYPVFAINSYYRDLKDYQGLNGTKYLSTLYPGDYNLINWVNENIKGQPVILEASGDSYTDYARISANTGLPTIIGWSVHEWLWRGSYDVAAPRIKDVETLYTTKNLTLFKSLVRKYSISYAVISSLEKSKYPNLNVSMFKNFGKLIYQNKEAKLYKIFY